MAPCDGGIEDVLCSHRARRCIPLGNAVDVKLNLEELATLGHAVAELALCSGETRHCSTGVDPSAIGYECEVVLRAAWDSSVVFRNGESRAVRSQHDLLASITDGTVFLEGVERRSEAVSLLLGAAYAKGFISRANVYLSGHRAPVATRAHRDGADLVILCLAGAKQWHVGDTLDYTWLAPLESHLETPTCQSSYLLKAGDLLFLPRGTAHYAQVVEGPTMHLAIAGTSPTVLEALTWLMHDTLGSDSSMRRSVDQMSVDELSKSLAEAVDSLGRSLTDPRLADTILLRELATVGSLSGARLLSELTIPAQVQPGATWAALSPRAVFAGGVTVPLSDECEKFLCAVLEGGGPLLVPPALSSQDKRTIQTLLEMGILRRAT